MADNRAGRLADYFVFCKISSIKRKEMMKKYLGLILVLIAVFICPLLTDGAGINGAFPKVIATNPCNGADGVDSSLSEIRVTFSKPMMNNSWSWSYEDKGTFPRITGQPYYTGNETVCVLPVKLEPGKRYVIWINTSRFKNFKDKNGNEVEPYKLVFTTRQK